MGGDNDDTKEQTVLALKQQGNKHFEAKEYAEAIKSFTAALEADPNNSIKHILLSNRSACHVLLNDLDTSLADANAAIEADAKYGKAHGRKAMALFKMNRLEEAAASKKEEGRLLQLANKHEAAAQAYSEAIGMWQQDASLFTNRASCYLRLDRPGAALKDARKAIALRKEWPRGYQRAVASLAQLGEFVEASQVLADAKQHVLADSSQSLEASVVELDDTRKKGFGVLQQNLGSHLLRCSDQKSIPLSEALGKAKKIGLYFSAHWCGPCRQFTPQLAELYREMNEKEPGSFVVIFCSSDHSQNEFENYCKEMPWYALPHGLQAVQQLSQGFRVQGIPHLAVINPNARTISNNGRSDVMQHRNNVLQAWTDQAQR